MKPSTLIPEPLVLEHVRDACVEGLRCRVQDGCSTHRKPMSDSMRGMRAARGSVSMYSDARTGSVGALHEAMMKGPTRPDPAVIWVMSSLWS